MPKIKLTPESVRGIRYAWNEEGLSMAAIAAIYAVSRIQVWRILTGKQHSQGSPSLRSSNPRPDFSAEIVKMLKSKGF